MSPKNRTQIRYCHPGVCIGSPVYQLELVRSLKGRTRYVIISWCLYRISCRDHLGLVMPVIRVDHGSMGHGSWVRWVT